MVNFWKLTVKEAKEQRDEFQLKNLELKKELEYRNRSYIELFEAYEKLKNEKDRYKRERDSLLKDIGFLHQLRKGDCSALDTLKAGNNHLIYERDELNEKLNKECNDNYKLEGQLHDMTKQRDELIKDAEEYKLEVNNLKQSVSDYKNLAEWHIANWQEYKALQHENRTLKDENKALRLQANEYFDLWQEAIKK